MQELIYELNRLERDGLIQIYKSPVGNDMLENIIPFLLEKEKEQIITAYDKGSDVNDDLMPFYGTPEQYYNQTYNQNKPQKEGRIQDISIG